jgi:hypothetical protein
MSVVQNPIVGRSSGKFSNAIFSKWKNKNTLRSKPLVVNQPNTPAQLTQRAVFKAAVSYTRQLLTFLRLSLKSVSSSMSEFNYFLKKLIPAIDRTTFVLNPALMEELQFSSGVLPGFQNASADTPGPLGVSLVWDDDYLLPLRNTTDVAIFVSYNTVSGEFQFFDDDILFTAGGATIIPAGESGDATLVYILTADADRKVFSNSQYVGEVNLL